MNDEQLYYKGIPITECNIHQLLEASYYVNERIKSIDNEIEHRKEMASLFLKTTSGKCGQKINETVLSLKNRQDELRNQAEQIKMEMERSLSGN